jgi:hypothetical protein
VIFAFTTLTIVVALIAAFLVVANRHANKVIKNRRFEHVVRGTGSHLTIVPYDKNTAVAIQTSGNVANSWPVESMQAASFGSSGRVQ